MPDAPLIPQLPPTDLVASGLFLRRADAPQWLLLRATKHGEWGFPKGHVDPGEDLVQTALRECAEECGIALLEIVGPAVWDSYRVPSGRSKATVYFPAITACASVVLSHEHDRFRWCDEREVAELLSHPTLLALFTRAMKAFPC